MIRRPAVRLALFALAALAGAVAWAGPPASEATVKAAFVYNFVKFVEWPAEAFPPGQDAIRLCLYGSPDPFLAALTGVDGKSAQNRPIHVLRITRQIEFRGCHVLAISESEWRQSPGAMTAADDLGAMTVGESDGFADAGGTIGLVVENERVQFEVNLEAARRANLKVSSQLLKLARKVRR